MTITLQKFPGNILLYTLNDKYQILIMKNSALYPEKPKYLYFNIFKRKQRKFTFDYCAIIEQKK